MAVYVWQGVDSRGKDAKGVRDADNPKALRLLLRKEGVLATSIEEESAARVRQARDVDFGRIFQRVTSADLGMFTRQLATLLQAGVPLVEALSALIEQTDNPLLKNALTQTRDKVNEGTSLAEALKAHPKIFETLYVNMIAAAEASGTLDTVLKRLADFLDAQSNLMGKVTGALAYPAFVAVMAIGVVTMMMTVVVPKVSAIFESFKQTLPWYTRLLIFTSDMFSDYWWLMLLCGGGGFYSFRRWRATPAGRSRWDIWMLTAPMVGKLVVMIAVARFTSTLATLLAAGVPMLTALDIARNVLGNSELMRVIEQARESIREGESISLTLKRSGRFPPIVTHMIAVGERSGQLEQMLEHVAAAYERQVEARITMMMSLLAPMMIVVMGGISGWIAFSIIIPLSEIGGMIDQ